MKITKTQNSRLANTDFNKLEFGKTFSDHMLMCKFQDGQWQEAEILPYQPLSFAPGTHVFHYGQAIFEGMKALKTNKDKQSCFVRSKHESFKPISKQVVHAVNPIIHLYGRLKKFAKAR